MKGISARGGVAALLGILICAPAIGQTPPRATKSASDPNAMICEKIEVIGSRLQTKRVCMTRSEWAERRLEDRLDLDKRQIRGYKFE